MTALAAIFLEATIEKSSLGMEEGCIGRWDRFGVKRILIAEYFLFARRKKKILGISLNFVGMFY